jgi:hypothetical protein
MFVVPLNAFTTDCTVHLGQQQNYRSMQCTKAALRVLLQIHFESLQQECYSQRRRLKVASEIGRASCRERVSVRV